MRINTSRSIPTASVVYDYATVHIQLACHWSPLQISVFATTDLTLRRELSHTFCVSRLADRKLAPFLSTDR